MPFDICTYVTLDSAGGCISMCLLAGDSGSFQLSVKMTPDISDMVNTTEEHSRDGCVLKWILK